MAILDNSTIVTIKGIDLEIIYDIHGEELPTNSHPGSVKNISIIQIMIDETDISLLISDEIEEDIKQILINK